ncbi:MAG TPA: hypothetical protein VMG10_09470 [Gemmataceae bacterium]|nr:hypothetical protein [Gemmataceae bacterium]
MFASLRTLLTGLIDYAGLFPPARLPLDQAIRNYARYRQEDDAWMLGRFVIPAARLEDLEPYHEELFRVDPPFTFSVLARGGGSLTEYLTNLRDDLRDIAAFRKRHGARVSVEVLETRLPPDLADPNRLESALSLYKMLRVFPAVGLFPFCEAPGRPEELLEQLARLPGERVGFKLRCGGLDTSAFPSSEQVANALWHCLAAGIPFKATAGLHHPLPRLDASVQARMHGFINVFLAGVLAYAGNLSVRQLRSVLEDDNPKHFSFTDKAAGWGKHRATTAEIAAARHEFVLSFGSCSFDEPRADLPALGWW